MPGKYALIIGNTEYTDSGLAKLTAPGRDAEDFARALQSAEIAAFDEVVSFVNENVSNLNEAIEDFFSGKKPDDLLVFYFSGHGVRDESGSLFLAVKNTNRSRLHSTAITADFVRKLMDHSRSRRQVIILDCCNSGAFAYGAKAETGGTMGIATTFEGTGYGRVVLTATDSTQFAWEGDQIIGDETVNSLFTHFLVKGLEGAADEDGDGKITVDELYDYTYEQIVSRTPKQTPGKWSYKQQGEIILRQSTKVEDIKPIPLPADLANAIDNSITFVRKGAVQQLEELLKGRNIGLAHSAKKALEQIAEQDDSRLVAQLAAQALASVYQTEIAKGESEEERKAKEQAERLAAQKVEEERLAKAKRAALAKAAREKVEREKIESQEKLARENAERETAQKAERKRAEQAAAQKADREKIEREAKDRLARETTEKATHEIKVQPVVAKPEPKKQIPFWGIGIAFAVLALIVWGLSSPPASPAATPTPSVTQTVFVAPATKTPVPVTSTAIIVPAPILAIGSTMIGKDNAILVYVPEGEFLMGSTDADTLAYADEKPQHPVTLKAFWIDETEVTNKQYVACVSGGGCTAPSNTSSATRSSYYGNSEFDEFPVIYVDWNKANAYCSWAGRRLPTEAEWEKAARGTDGLTYPWGNNAPNDTLLNYNQKIGDTTKVGSYKAGKSIYGAYDMAGNVWEWVSSLYKPYPYDASDGREDMKSSDARVLRGGAWYDSVSIVRSAVRSWNDPTKVVSHFGFRCARSLP